MKEYKFQEDLDMKKILGTTMLTILGTGLTIAATLINSVADKQSLEEQVAKEVAKQLSEMNK